MTRVTNEQIERWRPWPGATRVDMPCEQLNDILDALDAERIRAGRYEHEFHQAAALFHRTVAKVRKRVSGASTSTAGDILAILDQAERGDG